MSVDDSKQSKATIALLVETDGDNSTDVHDVNKTSPNSVFQEKGGTPDREKVKKVNVYDKLVACNMLVPDSQLGPVFQDQYRKIKRPLLSNAFGKTSSLVEHGNLILVTSSIPGEGKTYTSVNLALSIAQEKDNTVLLVDCDVAKQDVSRMLNVDKMPGLVDVLQNDSMTVGDVLLQTDVPNLRVLSAGKQDEYVTELLASQRMSDIVNELIRRYDDRVIIFDSPPLLSTPQTQVLAELVGQVVFIIEAGKTSQSIVEDALELIPEEKATGLIMNKNEGLSGKSGYGYNYYGDYSKEDGKNK